MIIIAKKYLFRLLLLLALAFASYHWFATYPAETPREIGPATAFVKSDILFHWDGFKQSVRGLQSRLTHSINTDDKVRRGAMDKLGHALDLYKAANESYPANIKDATTFYRNHNELLTDPSFKYESSADGKHFKISINLKGGQAYTVEK